MKRFDQELLTELRAQAEASTRRRAHHNVHEDYQQAVQRLFICMLPDSYVRPHRHSQPTKWEFFLVVEGHLELLFFNDNGVLQERVSLGPGCDSFGLEIPPNTWHATICKDPVCFVEVKQGPYEVTDDKDFAAWSPAEGEPGVANFMAQMRVLKPGETIDAY